MQTTDAASATAPRTAAEGGEHTDLDTQSAPGADDRFGLRDSEGRGT